MVEYLKFTPEMSNNWFRTWNETQKQRPWAYKRLLDASTQSQMESKLWLATELINVNVKPKNVALLGGWFAHIITALLIDELNVNNVINFEIDSDAHFISFKFNKRYQNKNMYRSIRRNIMINSLKGKHYDMFNKNEESWDLIINTSCEHMFPMWKFRELNPQLKSSWYVLQSTNDDQYDDHINCVKSPEELADQAQLVDILYSGSKTLSNGMKRFMVIGR
jgi:hypothetical protein